LAVGDGGDDPTEMMAAAGAAIVEGVERSGAAWATGHVERILDAWGRVPAERRAVIREQAIAAGRDAVVRVAAALRALLARDPAEQRATPLEVVRSLVEEPTELLRSLGVPPVVRDPFDERTMPHDDYDLAPRTLADVDGTLGPELLVWGVAKAKVLRGRAERGRAAPE
jgi:hypothetical protein